MKCCLTSALVTRALSDEMMGLNLEVPTQETYFLDCMYANEQALQVCCRSGSLPVWNYPSYTSCGRVTARYAMNGLERR